MSDISSINTVSEIKTHYAPQDTALTNIGMTKKATNQALFTCLSFSGTHNTAELRQQYVKIKALRFKNLYGPEAVGFLHKYGNHESIESIIRLCDSWQTSDFESVMTVHSILINAFEFTLAQIEKMKADELILHCYHRKQTLENQSDMMLSNSKGYHALFIRDFHHATFCGDEGNNYKVTEKVLDPTLSSSGGIHFLLSPKYNPVKNNYPGQDCIEIKCNLAHVLIRHGQIHKDVLSWHKNAVFVKFASDKVEIPFTPLYRDDHPSLSHS